MGLPWGFTVGGILTAPRAGWRLGLPGLALVFLALGLVVFLCWLGFLLAVRRRQARLEASLRQKSKDVKRWKEKYEELKRRQAAAPERRAPARQAPPMKATEYEPPQVVSAEETHEPPQGTPSGEQADLRRAALAWLGGGLRAWEREPPPLRYELHARFELFRDQKFRSLAQALRGATRTKKLNEFAWQIELSRHIFLNAAPEFLAALLLRSEKPSRQAEFELIDGFRARGVEELSKLVLRKAALEGEGGQIDDALRAAIGEVVELGLQLTWDVMTSAPASWFILPVVGQPFNPSLHQSRHDRAAPDAVVSAFLFPGYMTRGTPDEVVSKALVLTEDPKPEATPPPLPAGFAPPAG